jgi:hypothetical protein
VNPYLMPWGSQQWLANSMLIMRYLPKRYKTLCGYLK